MKTTGIIRRIDDLGRIVIPKEIRKTLRIIENDTVEVYVDDGKIILKKFSNLLTLSNYIQKILDIINSIYKCEIFVTDSSKIIAYAGSNKKKYINKEISNFLLDIIKSKKQVVEEKKLDIEILSDEKEPLHTNYLIFPVITFGNIHGLLMLLDCDNIDKIKDIGNIIVKLIESQIEFS